MTDGNEYTVSLTFREWMDVCTALGIADSHFRLKDMDGQANKYDAIHGKITEDISND